MFIVYKTTNIQTNEYYIGVHKISGMKFDGYFGSGRRIIRSVKKYGKNSFQRETLFEFDDLNEKLAFSKEFDLLSDKLTDLLCLNLGEGGKGGSNFKGRNHTDDTKRKLSIISKKRPPYKKSKELLDNERRIRIDKNDGKWFSEDAILKMSEKAKVRKRKKYSIKPLTDDQKRVLSDSLKEYWKKRRESMQLLEPECEPL